MTQTHHVEHHFTAGQTVRDVVIGMSDGLTVPFALAAGMSGAAVASRLVVTAGLAEVVAGSIAMGLGGYLAARSDAEHYDSERRREEREVVELPEREVAEVLEVLSEYGIDEGAGAPVVEALKARPKAWVDFMMKFELGLEEPDPHRALQSATTIAGSYAVGGLIPLLPYMLMSTVTGALPVSIVMTIMALAVFGYMKGRFTGSHPVRSAVQTTVIGGIAAAAAFAIAKAIS